MQAKTLVLFDIDGTLLLSGGAGNRSIDRVIEELYGLKNATQGIRFIGSTDKAIFQEIFSLKLRRSLSAGEENTLRERYAAALEEEIQVSPGFRVLPGAAGVVEALSRDSRFAIGLATGNLEKGARIKLRKAGLNEYFLFGGFDEDGLRRSEIILSAVAKGRSFHPGAFQKIFHVGDSCHDVTGAREAGVLSVAVGTDGQDKYELKKIAPDFFLSGLHDLKEVMAVVCS